MAKIILDKTKCIGCGNCVALCPKYFEMGQDGKSRLKNGGVKRRKEIEELEIEKIGCGQEAAESCPTQAITLENPRPKAQNPKHNVNPIGQNPPRKR